MAKTRARSGSLEPYHSMRDFSATPEPRGKVKRARGRLYTIQKHAARRLHYDLRLELDGVLKSWAVTKGPSLDPSVKRLAVRTEDHPVDYGTFEGRIPAGNYGAGSVLLWDRGTWEPNEDAQRGLDRGKLSFTLHGERLRGKWALVRMRGRDDEKRENWLLVKELDDEVERDGAEPTERYENSVLSGRDLDDVARAPEAVWDGEAKPVKSLALPRFVAPMLARLVDDVPSGDGWLYEVKLDGYRALAAVSGQNVRIDTRSGLDWTARYASIARALAELDLDRAYLDGEIIAVDDAGRSDFSALQASLTRGRGGIAFFVFDLLAEGGVDWTGKPQIERKRRLAELLEASGAREPIHYNDHLESGGRKMLDVLCSRGFEGIIAKRADATYRSGRGAAWLKVKCQRAQEFVIVGWAPSSARRPFASLLLGVHEGGELRYAGRVGTGFSEEDLAEIGAKLAAHERKTSAVVGVPRAAARNAHWVTPKLVAHVAFAEFTRDGSVRHARFAALRTDKDPKTITREQATPLRTVPSNGEDATMAASEAHTRKDGETRVAGVRLTHPERVLYPSSGLTKLDLARYLEAAAERMMPHLAQRLVSLVRCPEGRTGECFFQRHATPGMPEALHGFDLEESGGKTKTYLYVRDAAGLVSTAQIGALELHVWGSRLDDIDRPDRMVFDLDPDPELPFDAVRTAAQDVRAALEALDIESFPLLSGGKGVHVVAPLRRTLDWPTLKAFTRGIAEGFAAHDPDRFVAQQTKARRKGRIYVDYLRNDRASTAIAPYSVRAREGAPVACPIRWAELADIPGANVFKIEDALKRLARKDPWEGYFDLQQTLRTSALRAVRSSNGARKASR